MPPPPPPDDDDGGGIGDVDLEDMVSIELIG